MEWIILFGMGSSCYTIYKMIVSVKESDGTIMPKWMKNTLGWTIVICVFGYGYYHVETTKIKDGGIYYVNLFEQMDAQKNYRVPGEIYVEEDGYKLSQVYWSNGGVLTFYDSIDRDLIYGKRVPIRDDERKEWFAELTNEKAQKPIKK